MKTFSFKETNITKGVACILLLIHHLFYNPKRFDMFYHIFGIDDPPLVAEFAILSKVCVAIFVILSGYGLEKSAQKTKKIGVYFTYRHFVKLFCQFWFIFIIFVPLGFLFKKNPVKVYGTGIEGILNLVIDFCGLANIFNTPTMNATWWYMGAVIILYISFPFLFHTMNKNPLLIIIIAAIMCFTEPLTGRWYHAILVWILPFVSGMYLAQAGILDKIANTNYNYYVIILSFISIALSAVIRRMGAALKIDTFFAFTIIIFSLTFLSRCGCINTVLEFIGKHSANIFMMHTFIYSYYFDEFIYAPYYPVLIFLTLLISSLVVSVGLEWLKKLVKYEKLGREFLQMGDFLK